ncbi:MAG: OmpH family outer membrane protein [Prevotellaceae bacterium]|nr:OmpH family outer membrane protein [Candidatus Minthosoma caballi]
MKHILTIVALFACVGFVSAQETVLPVSAAEGQQVIVKPQHFGYLSYNDVMKAMPEYSEAMKSLADLKATYDQEMKRSEQDFSKKFAEYVEGQKSFPENIMLKRQKELQQLMEQSMQFKKEAEQMLTKAEAELMQPVNERLAAAIQSVGYESGYAYILNTDANAYPYISGNGEAENCTDKVLIKLGVK